MSYNQQYTRFGTAPNLTGSSQQTIPNGAAPISSFSRWIIGTAGTATMIPATVNDNANPDGSYDNVNDDALTCAAQNLSWADLSAYLAWACLAPMTELQFEKAVRGTLPLNPGEYVWGDQNLNSVSTATLQFTGNYQMYSTLSTTTSLGLCNYGNSSGVYRAGMLARSNTSRSQAGATYYGVMEMAGNVWEQVVGVSYGYNPYATANAGTGTLIFDGSNGYGVLTNNTTGNNDYGNCGMTSWPMVHTVTTAHAYGIALRGGAWTNTTGSYQHTSDRTLAKTTFAMGVASPNPSLASWGSLSSRNNAVGIGGRGVRNIYSTYP